MPKKLKKIPSFKSEKQEREFWQIHDSTEYVDWSKSKRASFPKRIVADKSLISSIMSLL